MNKVNLFGKKVVIIGGVAGGASCAARLRRLSETVSITMLERSSAVSFANCGLPYHIGGIIRDRSKLLLFTPESFKDRFNVDARVHSEAIEIQRQNRKVKVRCVTTNNEYELPYDYLVLACGAKPVIPPIRGVDAKGVFTLRTLDDLDAIMAYIQDNNVRTATVVGAGFIGLEVAENLFLKGIRTTIVEKMAQVMPMLDPEIAVYAENRIRKAGIKLFLNAGVTAIESSGAATTKQIRLENNTTINSELVIMAIGVTPDIKLAQNCGLTIGPTGGIKVDDQMRTSDPNIFAVGDSIEIVDPIINMPSRVALAGPANRQGGVAADVIAGLPSRYPGAIGTSIVKIFDVNLGSVGISEKRARSLKLSNINVAHVIANQHAGYYPGESPLLLKAVYTNEGQILGAQVAGKCEGVDKRIDHLAMAIASKMNVFDLRYIDFAYAPQFSTAKDAVNHLASVCADALDGMHPSITWDKLQSVQHGEIQLIDVRSNSEYAKGTIPGAQLIPLNELRQRLDEVNKDKDIVVFCRVGLRGYIATRILQEHGFNRVRNLMGGYLLYDELSQASQSKATEEIPNA